MSGVALNFARLCATSNMTWNYNERTCDVHEYEKRKFDFVWSERTVNYRVLN